MVRVAVAGYVALPGDGGHGSLPGDCSGIHRCCWLRELSRTLHYTVKQADFFDVIHFICTLLIRFTLYVLLYKSNRCCAMRFVMEKYLLHCAEYIPIQYVAVRCITCFVLNTVYFVL